MDRSRLQSGLVSIRVYRGIARFFVHCYRRRRILAWALVVSILLPPCVFTICWRMFPFPSEKLRHYDRSILVMERSGQPLLELVGRDNQRCRPVSLTQMSPWLVQAITAIEDERFESHSGVDWYAVARAVGQNLWARRTVSGASTITMQLCKMLDERPRTWHAKLIEAFRAVQLERQQSKSEILTQYLNRIPCGGNLRGVEAASQAYFQKSASQLSLGEAALLAGLPQSPSRYAPDRHPEVARRRREAVLRQMLNLGQITQAQFEDAVQEPVVVGSRAVRPAMATHAAWMALSQRPTGGRTTIDLDLQREVERIVADHASAWPAGADAAVVVIDVEASEIVALMGSANDHDPRDGQVNGAIARRSPGSTLKPFLYAAAFEAKRLAPDSLVDDVAIERTGWTPANFDRTYRGRITAAEALRQSLNVPAITITEGMGLPRCLGTLAAVGIQLPPEAESRGGLAVATGGLEVSLLELTNAYATLARDGLRREPRLLIEDDQTLRWDGTSVRVLEANVCRAVTSILSSEHRQPYGWELRSPANRPWFAWKTGTSSGRRDAWAIGHNGRYAIGVWVGFFHGTGHRDFVGREVAEPVLANLFTAEPFRISESVANYPTWTVTDPLPRPIEATGTLAILSPRNDSAFLAWNGSTVIHPSATSLEAITWFHNGRVLPGDEVARLIVPRGSHELRAVAASGQSAVVRFTVK